MNYGSTARLMLSGVATVLAIGVFDQASAQANVNDVPRCATPVGVLAVAEPDTNWWQE